jgi:Ca2+-binding RTX toxin-like protein
MAYHVTGTSGHDTLNQSSDSGPGTIVGLAGNDCMFTGTGVVSVDGGSGNDTAVLQAGNIGMVTGGTGNDCVFGFKENIGSMVLFGDEGADTITTVLSTSSQTILGGNDFADAGDNLQGGLGNDIIFGAGGNDTLDGAQGADSMIGGGGNDSIWKSWSEPSSDLVAGNEGDDSIWVSGSGGTDVVYGGQGDDSIYHRTLSSPPSDPAGTAVYFGNEGNDTINTFSAAFAIILGGDNSADGNDSLTGGSGADIILGNGGADIINGRDGANILIGGFGNDSILGGVDADYILGNENNDTINSAAGADTVFAGQGDDAVFTAAGNDTINGDQGKDTIYGGLGIDTISGGSGFDVFIYSGGSDDGDNVGAGGPTEVITDLNCLEDRFQTVAPVAFAGAPILRAVANLQQAATAAIAAVWAVNGSPGANVAAQFGFGGHTYVAINQGGALNAFEETADLLIDITGVAGTITAANFIT